MIDAIIANVAALWIICSIITASFFGRHKAKLNKAPVAKIFYIILAPVALGFLISEIISAVEE
jgi:hypothetical protein